MANWDPVRDSVGTNYEDLLSSNLSQISNNASLILRRMESLCEEGWPEWFDKLNTDALQISCENTGLAMRNMLEAADCQRPLRISSVMRKGARLILDCITVDRISGMDTLGLERASSVFLNLATDIETLLSILLFEREALISEALEIMLGSTTLDDQK
jgi:hypothetical protein